MPEGQRRRAGLTQDDGKETQRNSHLTCFDCLLDKWNQASPQPQYIKYIKCENATRVQSHLCFIAVLGNESSLYSRVFLAHTPLLSAEGQLPAASLHAAVLMHI